MSTITFVFIAGLVKALVDVLKRVIPPLNNDETVFGVDHFWAKLIAVVLSGVFVTAYNFNLPATIQAQSTWPGLDRALTIVAVALSAMGINDIGNFFGQAGSGPAGGGGG